MIVAVPFSGSWLCCMVCWLLVGSDVGSSTRLQNSGVFAVKVALGVEVVRFDLIT